jgi:hypothetical protein
LRLKSSKPLSGCKKKDPAANHTHKAVPESSALVRKLVRAKPNNLERKASVKAKRCAPAGRVKNSINPATAADKAGSASKRLEVLINIGRVFDNLYEYVPYLDLEDKIYDFGRVCTAVERHAYITRGACLYELRKKYAVRQPGGSGQKDTSGNGVTAVTRTFARVVDRDYKLVLEDCHIFEAFFVLDENLNGQTVGVIPTVVKAAKSLSRNHCLAALGASKLMSEQRAALLAAAEKAEARRKEQGHYSAQEMKGDLMRARCSAIADAPSSNDELNLERDGAPPEDESQKYSFIFTQRLIRKIDRICKHYKCSFEKAVEFAVEFTEARLSGETA